MDWLERDKEDQWTGYSGIKRINGLVIVGQRESMVAYSGTERQN